MRKVRSLGLCLAPIPVIATLFVAVLAAGVAAPGVTSAHAMQRQSVPILGRIHHLKNSSSTNWSGYASTSSSGHFTDVKGSWTQPSATCSSGQTAYSSFWVGIDGDNSNSVEQTGTDADCSSGTPSYYAWYEMYPKYPVNLSKSSYPVRPGDHITGEVKYQGSGSFLLTISNSTRGWSYHTTQSYSKAARSSAEWIAEAPSSSSGVLPLADFGTVYFTSCTANGVAISSNPNVDKIVMVTSSGTVKAQPSSLSGGNAFSVAWKHS